MDIRKGLTLTAYGFLFILINFNLILGDRTINVIPDFIGWVLLFLAFGKLGDYTKDCKWLRWLALVMVAPAAFSWVISLITPELAGRPELLIINNMVNMIASVGEMAFIVVMFTPLIRIAHDYGSDREQKFKTLRMVNLGMYSVFVCISVMVMVLEMKAGLTELTGSMITITVVSTVAGIALLVCAVITAISIFKLKNEVIEKSSWMRTGPDL